jgi:hypothetical protein
VFTGERQMNYDADKIDEYTLALLYLVVSDRQEGLWPKGVERI